MSNKKPIIIVGAGLAGTYAAETLRKDGYQGRIILLDKGKEMPYDRPPLSKEYMVGEATESDMVLFSPSIYDELNIELELGVEIERMDARKKEITSKDGRRFQGEKILLATGSNLQRLQVDGSNLKNIHYLKTISDAQRIKQAIAGINKLVIVGAGFIGAELASSCRSLGIDVTVIERSDLPMSRIFGDEIGEYFLDLHQSNGVKMITNDMVAAFNGDTEVREVVTTSGQKLECQAVVVGIGVEPDLTLNHDELETNRGYIVNEFGETSVPGIYAAGDCTVWPYKGAHINVEHWDHAVNHGKTVAKNMVKNQSVPYDRVPYFWSDQYNNRIQYVGHSSGWSKTLLRGNFKDNKFTYFFLDKDGAVEAAIIFNEPRNVIQIRRLIRTKKIVNPTDLADPNTILKKL